jgi:hypothetical protein
MNAISRLEQISNSLLQTGADQPGTLFNIVNDLYHLLVNAASLDLDTEPSREDLYSQGGKALGTTWAAMCIKDILRTKKFVDGIFEAVNDKLKEKTTPVHILYVGTGPFAVLILPLITKFNSQQVQFSFLEINKQSFSALQNIVNHFGMEDYVRRIENVDAITWKFPPNESPDIFLTETMQPALAKEPQVSIAMNIVPQLHKEAFIIPREITLTACLTNPVERWKEKMEGSNPAASTLALKEIFTLTRTTILTFEKQDENKMVFPKVELSISHASIELFPQLEIMTRINIYKEISIEQDECHLTTPLLVRDLSEFDSDIHVVFQYETGENPGIRVDIRKMD